MSLLFYCDVLLKALIITAWSSAGHILSVSPQPGPVDLAPWAMSKLSGQSALPTPAHKDTRKGSMHPAMCIAVFPGVASGGRASKLSTDSVQSGRGATDLREWHLLWQVPVCSLTVPFLWGHQPFIDIGTSHWVQRTSSASPPGPFLANFLLCPGTPASFRDQLTERLGLKATSAAPPHTHFTEPWLCSLHVGVNQCKPCTISCLRFI